MMTTNHEIGDMFWGKSQSYPWWPCVIMANSNNEIKRTRKKAGTQFHVQFLGPNYDVCWITNNFLIKYDGTDNFELYIEQKLRSSLPPQHKIIFDMKMSDPVHAMWVQACQDAEKIYQLPNLERTFKLPKAEILTTTVGTKKVKPRKRPSKMSSKASDTSTVSDLPSVESKYIDPDDSIDKDFKGNLEIEEICFRVYMAEETENRLKLAKEEPLNQDEVENILKEQWSVLDIEEKLLYSNSDTLTISKSRVSGRKIKVPSRLRRTNELETIKKTALKKRNSEAAINEKKKNNSSDVSSIAPSVTTTCEDTIPSTDPTSLSLKLNSIYRETLDSLLLKSLILKDNSMEIVKLVANKQLPIVSSTCHQCLKPLKPNEKQRMCKSDTCQASYHLICALQHKLFRSDEGGNCLNCVAREYSCCICNNSKYMKKQLLVKCECPGCALYFHSTCLRYLNFVDVSSNDRIVICPNHSCLTCNREDMKHPCNGLGQLVTCIKCPVSYHASLLCVPAGCHVVSSRKMICYRHMEQRITLSNRLNRCFVCFGDMATLCCCRCNGVFHPKCMNMPTYTDLLKDYVCPTCKLEKPVFYGQIIWAKICTDWVPAEIIAPSHWPAEQRIRGYLDKMLVIRDIPSREYHGIDICESIPFRVGESALKDFFKVDKKDIDCARKMNTIYMNWRKRLLPYQSEKVSIIGQSELLRLSVVNLEDDAKSTNNYQVINKNRMDKSAKNLIPKLPAAMCSCSNDNDPCDGNYCYNFINKIECNKENCKSFSCKNKKFSKGFSVTHKPVITDIDIINGLGVKIFDDIDKGEIIGECMGRIISVDTTLELMNHQSNLDSNYYVFHLLGNVFLDCEHFGNEWRYLNHSCNANAELVCWHVSGELRLGISLLRSISHEEVTINYEKSGLVLKYGFSCQCQSPTCSGTIGPTSIFANQTNLIVPRCCIDNKIIDESAILDYCSYRSSSQQQKSPHDNSNQQHQALMVVTTKGVTKSESLVQNHLDKTTREKLACHRCNEHGELISCSKAKCNKRYHLLCVEMPFAPRGLWFCPKHYCIECGHAAVVFCSFCCVSHCKTHSPLQSSHLCFDQMITEDAGEENKTTRFIDESMSPMELMTTPNIIDDVDEKGCADPPSVKATETMDTEPSDSQEIVCNRSEIKPICSSPTTLEQVSRVINKKDLYSSCGLVPIENASEFNPSTNNQRNGHSPSQVNLTVKRQADGKEIDEKTKKRKMPFRSVSYNISNYVSTDDEMEMCPEPIEDSNDTRCQVTPMGIKDMENLIISPVVLDD